MIANKEDVPKRIKVNGCIYNWVGSGKYYKNEGTGPATLVQNYLTCAHNLRSNVEILEDEEEIDIQSIQELDELSDCEERNMKINEILKAVKQLDKKIDKED